LDAGFAGRRLGTHDTAREVDKGDVLEETFENGPDPWERVVVEPKHEDPGVGSRWVHPETPKPRSR